MGREAPRGEGWAFVALCLRPLRVTKEQRELKDLPAKVAELEAESLQINALLNGVELYAKGAAKIAEVTARAGEIEVELLASMERWEQLEAR